MTGDDPHVVHVITRYLYRGGAERNTKHTMRFLAEKGVSVTLVAGRNSDTEHLADEPFAVQSCEQLVNHMDPLKDTSAVSELQEVFNTLDPDVVHTHQGKAGLVGRLAAILSGVPKIVYGLHGDHVAHPKLNGLTRPVYRGLEHLLGRYTDFFVSVGNEIQQRYINRGIGSPDQHVVIPSPIELEVFRSSCFNTEKERNEKKRELGVDDPEAPVVGMVASLEPRKGYDDAIRVARKLLEDGRTPDVYFLFVGNGPLRDELEQEVRKHGLEDRVIFTGYREDIAAVMECFDLFMFTSHMEGLPQVMVQAAVTALPIVSFNVEGAHEIIHDGHSGYVLNERDASKMAHRLTELLKNSERREEFGRVARDHVDDRWSIDAMRSNIIQFYRNVFSDLNGITPVEKGVRNEGAGGHES